jgi:long-subunit acyl-CoA synthetase (AMP-forming)
VEIPHRAICFNGKTLSEFFNYHIDTVYSLVSYLPLSHVAEQLMSLYTPLASGGLIWFADRNALQGSLINSLVCARPTMFLGVPRVWEKIKDKIMASFKNSSAFQKWLLEWAKTKGLEGGKAMEEGKSTGFGYWIAKTLIFDKIKKKLGFDRSFVLGSSAAPLSVETIDFFTSLGMPLQSVFGMSEVTGPATLQKNEKFKKGTVGYPMAGVELKLSDDGELLIRGNGVCKGYYKDPERTKEILDEEGWLHTGDVATFDKDGFVTITDRKKELIITSGGENVAPAIIEIYLQNIPIISQAIVIGEQRKFISALISLDKEKLQNLSNDNNWTFENDIEKAVNDKGFVDWLLNQIEENVNSKLSRASSVKKVTILREDLSIDKGELTPTMKVKRRVVNEVYREDIENM